MSNRNAYTNDLMLSRLTRSLARLCFIVALFCFASPLLSVLLRTYEGGETILGGFLFGIIIAAIGAVHFGCHCYARRDGGNVIARGFIWGFVVLTGLIGAGFFGRIIWVCTQPTNF